MNTTERKTVWLPLKEGDKETLEEIGLTILPNENNQLLTQAILPDGWYSKIDNHYWSFIYDEKERERISVFIKLAFWDTDGSIRIYRRFNAIAEEVEDDNYVGIVKDTRKEIYRTEVIKQDSLPKEKWAESVARNKAREWLQSNYPNWENRLAYWD